MGGIPWSGAAQSLLTPWSINQAFLLKHPTGCCSPISQAACIQHWCSPLSFKRWWTPEEVVSPVTHSSQVVRGVIRKIGCHTTVMLPIKPTPGLVFRYAPTWHLIYFMKCDFWIKVLWTVWEQCWCNSPSDKHHTLLLITPVKVGGRRLRKKLECLIG